MNVQQLAAERNLSVYCQDHGALPGERCTPTMRACSLRKRAARDLDAIRTRWGAEQEQHLFGRKEATGG